MENLEKFASTIESGFVGRSDKPQLVKDQFQSFWSATYGTWTTPAEGWPESIQRCLGINVETMPSANPSPPSSPLPPSSPTLSVCELPRDCTPEVVTVPELPTTPTTASPACDSGPLHSQNATSAGRQFLEFAPTISPTSPLQIRTLASPVTPKRVGKRAWSALSSVTGSTTPKSKRRRIEAGNDKENVSSNALSDLSLVSERIVMKSLMSAMVLSPGNRKSSGAIKRQLAAEDEEKGEESVERPSPLKRGRINGEARSKKRAPSPTQGSDDSIEERHVALSLLQPSPCSQRPQKRWLMDFVEVPSFEEVLFNRRSKRAASLESLPDSMRMKTPVAFKEQGIQKIRPSGKSTKTDPDPFRSSPPFPALRLPGINTAKLVRTVSAPAAVPPSSSSDDDPRYGQVTPHHLISPALKPKKAADLFDPPSDDSLPPSSPTKAVAIRRSLQRTGSVGSVV